MTIQLPQVIAVQDKYNDEKKPNNSRHPGMILAWIQDWFQQCDPKRQLTIRQTVEANAQNNVQGFCD